MRHFLERFESFLARYQYDVENFMAWVSLILFAVLFLSIFLCPILSHAEGSEPDVSFIGNSVVVECNGETFKHSKDSTDELWSWIREVCKLDQNESK